MNQEFNICGEYVFRGIEYRLSFQTLQRPGPCLSIEVEDKVTGDQWKGIFDSAYIEELTHKTGNFKQFDVFLSMLESALDKSTESVMLDLLTFSDLELLRNRKAVSGGYQGPNKPKPASKHQENKRYLILVYSVEFDRIHYPLPLPYQGKPDPVHLQNLVRQLNEEIAKLKSNKSTISHDKAFRLKEDYDTLLEEKRGLEEAFLEIKSEMQKNGKLAVSKEVRILKKVVQNLELEMLKEKNRLQRVISKKSAEVKRLTEELHDLSARERTLQIRVKSLTNELALYKRSRTPVASSSFNRDSKRKNPTRSAERVRSRASVVRPGSQSNSFSRRRSNSFERPPSQPRERSSSRGRFKNSGNRSRTPTPNRFPRFDPTLYNEEKKKRIQASQERLKYRTMGFSHGSGDSRGRNKSRPASGVRRRNTSLESRNSSDNGSASRKSNVWGESPTYVNNSRRLSSTPNVFRHGNGSRTYVKKRTITDDPDIDEIDARLEALQQYMQEIK